MVATLAMVETPTATAFKIDAPESDDVDAPLLDKKVAEELAGVESEILVVKTKPITANIRRTMKHLRSQGGRWAGFRGLSIAIMYRFTHSFVVLALSAFLHTRSLAAILATVLLCRMQMYWTHTVISTSTKNWYLPSFHSMKTIILPTAIWAVAEEATVFVPLTLIQSFGMMKHMDDPNRLFNETSPAEQKEFLIQGLIIFVASLVTEFLILFPATITLTRVQGSLLPEENDTIVPFDRTFGGKVQPDVLGGNGAVSMLDAWKTFDWSSRIRLVKLYVKVMMIELAIGAFFGMIIGAEMVLVLKNRNVKA